MGESKWLSITQTCWWDTCTPRPLGWLVHSCSSCLEEGLRVPRSFLRHCRSWIQDSLHGEVSKQAWKPERTHEVSSYDLRVEWDYAKYVTGFVGNGLIYFFIHWTPLQTESSCLAPCLRGEMQPVDPTHHVGLIGDHILHHRLTFICVFTSWSRYPSQLTNRGISNAVQFPYLLNMGMLPWTRAQRNLFWEAQWV